MVRRGLAKDRSGPVDGMLAASSVTLEALGLTVERVTPLADAPEQCAQSAGNLLDLVVAPRDALESILVQPGDGVVDDAHPGAQGLERRLTGAAACGTSVGEPSLDGVEMRDVEEPFEQESTIVGARAKELSELVLRQENHLRELFEAHAQGVVHHVSGLVDALGHDMPGAFTPLTEQDARLPGGGAVAASLGGLPLRSAPDPPAGRPH